MRLALSALAGVLQLFTPEQIINFIEIRLEPGGLFIIRG